MRFRLSRGNCNCTLLSFLTLVQPVRNFILIHLLSIKEMKGIIMPGDIFGPIADNATGISEMARLGEKTGAAGEALDAMGNVPKTLAKGYAMSAATMGSMVILFSYLFEIARLRGLGLNSIDDLMVNLVNPPNVTS